MRHKRYILTLTIISAILFSGMAAFAGTAYSPKKTKIKIWEPYEWHIGHAPGDALISQLTGAKDQGYDATAVRWQDTNQDGGVEQCARSRWNVLADNSGVTLVHTHANASLVVAATGKYQDEVVGWEDWEGTGSNDPNIVAIQSGYGCWDSRVQDGWFDANWKGTHDTNKAIVYMAGCNTSGLLDNVGGRVRFGYSATTDAAKHVTNINKLFGRMNGTVDAGSKRKAGVAYDGGTGYEASLTLAGENDTTLCPAPVDWNPKGPGAGQAGTGEIIFDTHCDSAQQATSALTKEILKGEITIDEFRWDNDYTLKFDYNTDDCDEDYKVKMTAVANHVIAKDGGQNLDADKVAPNTGNKDWTFED